MLIEYLTDYLMVHNNLIADGLGSEFELRDRYLGIDLLPDAWHDIGLIIDMLANHRVVELGNLTIHNQVGDRSHLDINQLHIIFVLISTGGELDRLEPLIHNLALQRHVIAFMQS